MVAAIGINTSKVVELVAVKLDGNVYCSLPNSTGPLHRQQPHGGHGQAKYQAQARATRLNRVATERCCCPIPAASPRSPISAGDILVLRGEMVCRDNGPQTGLFDVIRCVEVRSVLSVKSGVGFWVGETCGLFEERKDISVRANSWRWSWTSIWDYHRTGRDQREVRSILQRCRDVAWLDPVDDLSEASVGSRRGVDVDHDEDI